MPEIKKAIVGKNIQLICPRCTCAILIDSEQNVRAIADDIETEVVPEPIEEPSPTALPVENQIDDQQEEDEPTVELPNPEDETDDWVEKVFGGK